MIEECKTETTDQVPCPYCGRRPYLEQPVAGTIAALIGLMLASSVAFLPTAILYIHESFTVFKGSEHGWNALTSTGMMLGLAIALAAFISFWVAGHCFFGPPTGKD
jgi:hypothetical protein